VDAFLHLCKGIGGIRIIVWGSKDVLDECILQSLFEEFYDSMAVNIKFCGCDELFEPGDESVQVVFVLQCLKFTIGVVLLVGVSERILEIGFKGGPVSFTCFWYVSSDVVLK